MISPAVDVDALQPTLTSCISLERPSITVTSTNTKLHTFLWYKVHPCAYNIIKTLLDETVPIYTNVFTLHSLQVNNLAKS